jgi:hypothetical protein
MTYVFNRALYVILVSKYHWDCQGQAVKIVGGRGGGGGRGGAGRPSIMHMHYHDRQYASGSTYIGCADAFARRVDVHL